MTARRFHFAAAAILVLALGFRIAAARGDLWLDELWTLYLLEPITSPGQIFWKINHDNNHILNSLWMYWLGSYKPSLLYRLPAILLGTLSVGAAGLWARRNGVAAALAAMVLLAGSYAMVDLGSEARGYAGLILFAILALYYAEAGLEGKPSRLALGVAILLGVLSHLLMFIMAALLALWVLCVEYRREGGPWRAFAATLRLFAPAILLVLPMFCWLAWSVTRHQFVIGAPLPFDPVLLGHVFGRMIESCAALPLVDNPWVYVALACAAVLLRHRMRRARDLRSLFYLLAVAGIPLLLLVGQAPNTAQPRYFLISALAFVLFLADSAGQEWQGGGKARRGIVVFLALILVSGNARLLANFLRDGRGHYSAAMRAMAVSGPALYGGRDNHRNPIVEQYYARKLGISATYIPFPEWCVTPPQWLLLYQDGHEIPAPSIEFGPAACQGRFASPQVFPEWGFAGIQWTLYHRE